MKNLTRLGTRLTLLALLAALGTGTALADKPSWAGGGKQDARGEDRYDQRRGDRRDDYWGSRDVRFHDDFRVRIHDYYGEQFRRGHCPKGLAKKGNGCMPPGQARKWERGRPLPRDVVYVPLPHELMIQLPPPPMHHQYVRVASDILLIATGTAMVVDAIEDLGRLP